MNEASNNKQDANMQTTNQNECVKSNNCCSNLGLKLGVRIRPFRVAGGLSLGLRTVPSIASHVVGMSIPNGHTERMVGRRIYRIWVDNGNVYR